jgi:hypothetical protein
MMAWLDRLVRKWKPVIQVLTWIGGAASLVAAVVAFLQVHHQILTLPPMAAVIKIALVTQTITVLLLLICVEGPPAAPGPENASAIVASRQFSAIWAGVWLTLSLLWLARTWGEFTGSLEAIHYLLDVLNTLSAGLVLLSFLCMVLRSTGQDSLRWFRIVVLVILGCMAIVLVEFLVSRIAPGARPIFHEFLGLFSGVTLALLIGRLESRFIASSIWIVALLYAYAVLQFAYPIIAIDESTDHPKAVELLFVSSMALFLKILLFWHVRKIIATGQLTNYMRKYRTLLESPSTVP